MRSVLLRAAGATVAIALWLMLLILALANLDTGLPEQPISTIWPFLAVVVAIILAVAYWLNRRPGSPGWLHFLIGLLIPEIAFVVNRLFQVEVGPFFWIAVLVLVLIPLPARSRTAAVS